MVCLDAHQQLPGPENSVQCFVEFAQHKMRTDGRSDNSKCQEKAGR
nr:MAG TPA: hypothetical protein [Caudoviricetes sp.]